MADKSSQDISIAPWIDVLTKVRKEGFSPPWKTPKEESTFSKYMATVIQMEDELHFEKDSTQPYVKYQTENYIKGQGVPDYSATKYAKVPEDTQNVEDVLRYLMKSMFCSMNNYHHPLFLANVIPPPSLAGLLGAIIGLKLNANIVDEHFSMNVAKAELELASMISHLMPIGHGDNKWPRPWAPPSPDSSKHFEIAGVTEEGHGSGGISTFGGTGCYLYGVKYALTKVANSGGPEGYHCRKHGFEKDKFVILCSNQGHYVQLTTTDWTGLGSENAILIATKEDNTLDHVDLLKKMNEVKSQGKVIVAIIPTFGTTDAGALEDIGEIRKIIRHFDNIEPYCKPLLYVDSVIGWVWLFFIGYDFVKNPLGFRQDLLEQIKFNADRAIALTEADAFGTDFHKTGYTHYVSSMLMIKDYGDFASIMQRDPAPYLQQEQYDPALYTLECSRSPSGVLGTWSTFKHLGKNGMRSIMYNLMEKQDYLRKKLLETGCVVICNADNHFYCTLFRVAALKYSRDAYEEELRDESKYTIFNHINEFQKLIYLRTYEELRKNTDDHGYLTPHISISTGFRSTYYNPHGDKLEPDGVHPMQGVFALKCFLSSPFIDFHHMDLVVEIVMQARAQVLTKLLEKANHPLHKKLSQMVHEERPDGVHRHHNIVAANYIPVQDLLSTHHDRSRDPEYKELSKRLQAELEDRHPTIQDLRQQVAKNEI